MHNLTKEIYDSIELLFVPWGGMADRDEEFLNEKYKSMDLDNFVQLEKIIYNEFLFNLTNNSIYEKREIVDAVIFAIKRPDEIDLEQIFDDFLIWIKPPSDKKRFFEIVLQECNRCWFNED